ncbi:MAG TPA: hypothetical protein VMD56_08370 [Steroidobacteraceae bacterium]|nr:hypothetical protein [Steroidobacteraceae bacterium]
MLLDIGIAALSPRNTWSDLPSGFVLGQVPGLVAGTLSDTSGFTPNSGGYIYDYAAFPQAASSQGTIYMRLQRQALSIDDSTDAGATFFDSTGNTTGGFGGNAATAFTVFDGVNNLIQWAMSVQANGAQVLDAGSWLYPGARYGNSHGSSNLDPTDEDIVFTWQGSTYWAYFDGSAVAYGTFPTALPSVGQFAQVIIGGYLGGAGSAGQPLGPFSIQRFQLSTAYSPPPVLSAPVLIGFYGDSFVVQGGGVSEDVPGPPSSPSVAAVNAVQAQLAPTESPEAYSGTYGQDPFIVRTEAYALRQLGGYFPSYTAAESGHGWAYTGMGGTTIANTPAIDDFDLGKTGYSDALNAARPDYIFAFGSVNDVNNGTPGDIVGDTQAHFDYWANNNPNLKGIFYIETLSWELATGACTSHGGPAGWIAEMQRQRNLLRAAFARGYLAGTRQVPVTYIESYESWVDSPDSARFLIASNPDNNTQSANAGSSPNGHPDAEGNLQMADAYVWPYLQALLSGSGNLQIIGAAQNTSIAPGQTATLTVMGSGAGPFTYQWYLGPSGNESSPIAGATGPAFTTPELGATTDYWVQITGPNAELENSTTITVAVIGSDNGTGSEASGVDAPLPLWSTGVLGGVLLGIAARYLRRRRERPGAG